MAVEWHSGTLIHFEEKASLSIPNKLGEVPAESLRQSMAEVEGRSPVPVLNHRDTGSADPCLLGKRRLRPLLLLAGLLDQGDNSPGELV